MRLQDGTTLDLSDTDAMIATILAVDAFADAFDQANDVPNLVADHRHITIGVVLTFDAIMRRVRPHLPKNDPRLAQVYAAIEKVDATAKAIRERYGLPPVV